MPSGNFNISRLISELGLKNVSEMPPAQHIQTVIPLDTMRGQVPLHQGPVGLFGGATPNAAAEFSAFEIVSRDPGGCVITWLHQITPVVTLSIIMPQIPVIWGAFGPVNLPAQNFGSDPIQSTVAVGTIITGAPLQRPLFTDIPAGMYAPLFLPPGTRVLVQNVIANTLFWFTLALMGIQASEGDPA